MPSLTHVYPGLLWAQVETMPRGELHEYLHQLGRIFEASHPVTQMVAR